MKHILFSVVSPTSLGFCKIEIGLYSEGDAFSSGLPSQDTELSSSAVVQGTRFVPGKQLGHRTCAKILKTQCLVWTNTSKHRLTLDDTVAKDEATRVEAGARSNNVIDEPELSMGGAEEVVVVIAASYTSFRRQDTETIYFPVSLNLSPVSSPGGLCVLHTWLSCNRSSQTVQVWSDWIRDSFHCLPLKFRTLH
ncbi:hypothetical protein NC651_005974 [Populus alba x Populus x berolinensis]|nr:hypothetical protein NC651_005974 [Populus alba x Populus x berolinensis]